MNRRFKSTNSISRLFAATWFGVLASLLGCSNTDGVPAGTGGMVAIMTGGTPVATGGETAVVTGGMVQTTGGDIEMDAGMLATNPCSIASASPGCEDPAITACVCEDFGSAECCANSWDVICVGTVVAAKCKGDCCKASGGGGCADQTVEQAVCASYPDCCDVGWDEFCTILAANEGVCPAT